MGHDKDRRKEERTDASAEKKILYRQSNSLFLMLEILEDSKNFIWG